MHPTRPDITVRRAAPADAGPLIAVLAEAFLEGPVAEWLIPDATHRRVVYYRFFKLILNHGLQHGRVDTTTDLSALAIWYTRTEVPPPSSPEFEAELEQATGKYAHKFRLLEEVLNAHHPRLPHHYLAAVAVDPEHQGHGIGAALIKHHHQVLELTNMPAYLQASNDQNRRLYVRLGYTQVKRIELPTDGPTIWHMWRGQPNGGIPASLPTSGPEDRRRIPASPAMTVPIRRAQSSDVPAIMLMLTAAFETDPVAEWLAPDLAERVSLLHRLLAVDVDHAVETGHVDVAVDMSAVAVWRHHDPDSNRPLAGDYHLTTFAGRAAHRLAQLNTAIDSYRSAGPHHWLSCLGVHPDRQGHSRAGELLRHYHQVVDDTGYPVYTVVTTEAARDLLQQNGYHPDLPLYLPNGPKLWPLTRTGRPVRVRKAVQGCPTP